MFNFLRLFAQKNKMPKGAKENSIMINPKFHFSSGLVVKNGDVSLIRGVAYDTATETPIGAWGRVMVDGVEHYTSISLHGYSRQKLEQAPVAALAKAMEQARIKGAEELAAYIQTSLKPSR